MELPASVHLVSLAWWIGSILVRLTLVAAVFLHPRLRRARRDDQPPVSIIIPVRQSEPDIAASFGSVLSQSYPAFEVLVSAAEEYSPALAAYREVAARYPRTECRFLTGNPAIGLNPKVSNLAPAIAAARHDLILTKDSNVTLAAGQLAKIVRDLAGNAGLVCAIALGVCPKGLPARLECFALNVYGPPPHLAASLVGLPAALGKVTLFRRSDFERAGGIPEIADTISSEDNALGWMFRALGLRTVFNADPVSQHVGRRRFSDVWDRQLRWMVVRRAATPLVFLVEPFLGLLFTVFAGALGAAALDLPWWLSACGTIAVWRALDTLILVGRGWGWSWKSLAAALCWDLLMPALWFAALFARTVRWGGSDINLVASPRDRKR